MNQMGNMEELAMCLNNEIGNINYVQDKFSNLKTISMEKQIMYYNNPEAIKSIIYDAINFFSTNRCVYTYETILWLKKRVTVKNEKIYLFNGKFNYWEELKNKTQAVSKIRDYLEEIYNIKFSYLEMRGITVNPKIRTLVNNICMSSRFKDLSLEIQKKINESSDWINFKNCCYNIETNEVIFEEERRMYAFDSYINANYLYDKVQKQNDEYQIKDDMKYIIHFIETSLNNNYYKYLQIGQHLVYSILTKTKQRKAKEVLLILGEHDVGKSCLIDLFMSYFPPGLVSNLSPTGFKTPGARAKLFDVRLNATHETSSERNLPVSEFNKTVWVNLDQAVVNNKIYRGDYLQLHQVYAANQFFNAKDQYNPKDYLPKINLLIVDGKPEKKITDLSAKLIEEKDIIITYFLAYVHKWNFNGYEENYLSVYEKLKEDNFKFIELEDAIEFKNEFQAAYDEETLAKSQKKKKKLDTSILDYGVNQFLKERIDFYNFDDKFLGDIKTYNVEQVIKLILAKVPNKNRILFDDLYSCYANYCYEKNIEAYTSSMFKKKINSLLQAKLLIESKIKSGKEIINYKKQYKKIIENEKQLVIYKKFKDKKTGDNKIGYIGIKVKDN